MSLDVLKSRILCDNSDCGRDAPVPIVTKIDERGSSGERRSNASGWLFVRGSYEDRHYCPDCGGKVLR